MVHTYTDNVFFTAINRFIYPMISEEKSTSFCPCVSIEELLLYVIRPENCYTHLVIPILKEYDNKINKKKLLEKAEKNDVKLINAFYYLCYKRYFSMFDCKKEVSLFNQKISQDFNLFQHEQYIKIKDVLGEVHQKCGVNLYITERDLRLNVTKYSGDLHGLKKIVFSKLLLLSEYLRSNGISYAIGGGMGIYLHTGFETSLDIDVIINREFAEILRQNIKNICLLLSASPIENLENYIKLEINQIPLSVDFEVGQHYKSSINVSKYNSNKISIYGYEINLLNIDVILNYKKKYGRLKDINNIINLYR